MKALRFALALVALASFASADQQRTFARNYDLNVPVIAATTNRIVTSVNLTNTTLTIAAQPDVPRNITITVTDTTPTVVAGTVTVTCVDPNGSTITEVLDMAGPTLTFTGTKICETITSVVVAGATVLGGAGDETIIVGVGSVVSYIYCETTERIAGLGRVLTNGSNSTVTAVGTTTPFGVLTSGDDIIVNTSGSTIERRIVNAATSASTFTITVAADWDNSDAGYSWAYRHRTCDYDDSTGWIGTAGLENIGVKVEIGDGGGAAVTATGGVDISIECQAAGDATAPAQVLPINWPSAQTLRPTHSDVFIIAEKCSAIRVGWRFGTVDTTGTDSVSAYLVGVQK